MNMESQTGHVHSDGLLDKTKAVCTCCKDSLSFNEPQPAYDEHFQITFETKLPLLIFS